MLTTVGYSRGYTVAVLGIVFKQRITPCRTMTVTIGAVCVAWIIGTPYRRTAGGIGYNHAFAHELSHQLNVWSLAATGACTRELQHWLVELRTVYCIAVNKVILDTYIFLYVFQ